MYGDKLIDRVQYNCVVMIKTPEGEVKGVGEVSEAI